jgi:hypothetical protein
MSADSTITSLYRRTRRALPGSASQKKASQKNKQELGLWRAHPAGGGRVTSRASGRRSIPGSALSHVPRIRRSLVELRPALVEPARGGRFHRFRVRIASAGPGDHTVRPHQHGTEAEVVHDRAGHVADLALPAFH